jgi:DNA-binding response OmpR family regulator
MNESLNQVTFYILIVDDDKDDHFFLRKAITKVVPQAIIESLYDGSEALSFLNTCTSLPNLIFLDMNMTRMSGKDTIKEIRANVNLEKVPVIILTTSKSPREKEESLKLGANDFYTKPDHPKDLILIIEAVSEKFLWSLQ